VNKGGWSGGKPNDGNRWFFFAQFGNGSARMLDSWPSLTIENKNIVDVGTIHLWQWNLAFFKNQYFVNQLIQGGKDETFSDNDWVDRWQFRSMDADYHVACALCHYLCACDYVGCADDFCNDILRKNNGKGPVNLE